MTNLLNKSLISEFIDKTQMDYDIAFEFLKENEWDVDAALHQFKMNKKCMANSKVSSSSNSLDALSEKEESTSCSENLYHFPAYGFVLPDMMQLPEEFRCFMERDLIEMATLKRLENSGHLNWWFWNSTGQRLWPLSTTGDGNCLLHAASLGMWGIHDRQLMLRSIVHEMLTSGTRRYSLWRRWRWAESKINMQSGLLFNEEEWDREWKSVLNMATTTPRSNTYSNNNCEGSGKSLDQVYSSLEAIHVFALAHVLKRPIVVVSDTVLRGADGDEFSPILFGGIYLPLECAPSKCYRSPLVLCYDSGHFSAVVPMRQFHPDCPLAVIPIVDRNGNLLPIHFAVDPGPDFTWWNDAEDHQLASTAELDEVDQLSLVCEYMCIMKAPVKKGSAHYSSSPDSPWHRRRLVEISTEIKKRLKKYWKKRNSAGDRCESITCKDLHRTNLVLAAPLYSHEHQYMRSMVKNYLDCAWKRFEALKNTPLANQQRLRISSSFSSSSPSLTCINSGCEQAASQTNNFLCEDCFQYQKKMMISFGSSPPGYLRLLRSCQMENEPPSTMNTYTLSKNASLKSNTMPSLTKFSVTCDDAINGNCLVILSGNALTTCDAASKVSSHEKLASDDTHTIAMHYAERPFDCVKMRITSKKNENGVTHYYVYAKNTSIN